jgi:hypothetical protein
MEVLRRYSYFLIDRGYRDGFLSVIMETNTLEIHSRPVYGDRKSELYATIDVSGADAAINEQLLNIIPVHTSPSKGPVATYSAKQLVVPAI